MAVTRGHGNPNWTRDETILALDVYFQNRTRNLGPKDPQVIALSETLRRLPYHKDAARQPTFRNPDGAAFKVQNLRSQETGRGLQNVSQMDRAIWSEFKDNPAEVARLAGLIRISINSETELSDEPQEEGLEFYEGRLLTRSHLRRERNRRLRVELLNRRRKNGAMKCDVCGDTHDGLPPELREAAFEAHHLLPLAIAGHGPTKLEDMALLCATCHRLMHRLIALQRRWLTVGEAKAILSPGS